MTDLDLSPDALRARLHLGHSVVLSALLAAMVVCAVMTAIGLLKMGGAL